MARDYLRYPRAVLPTLDTHPSLLTAMRNEFGEGVDKRDEWGKPEVLTLFAFRFLGQAIGDSFTQYAMGLRMLPALRKLAADLDWHHETSPPWLILIIERRHITWPGLEGFVDMRTDKFLQQLPSAPLTTYSYNLNEAIRREIQYVERRLAQQGRQDASAQLDEQSQVPGGVDEP